MTHFFGIFALGMRAADSDNLLGSECLGKEYAEMSQAAHANDADRFSGPASVVLQGAVHRHAATE